MGWARAKDGERKRCPKSMKAVLEERGVNTERMKADDMRTVLSFHDDFVNEQTMVEKLRATSASTCLSSIVNATPSKRSGDKPKRIHIHTPTSPWPA